MTEFCQKFALLSEIEGSNCYGHDRNLMFLQFNILGQNYDRNVPILF